MWFMNGVKPHKHLSPLALKGRVGANQHGNKPTWQQPTWLLTQYDGSEKNKMLTIWQTTRNSPKTLMSRR